MSQIFLPPKPSVRAQNKHRCKHTRTKCSMIGEEHCNAPSFRSVHQCTLMQSSVFPPAQSNTIYGKQSIYTQTHTHTQDKLMFKALSLAIPGY